MCDLLRNRRAFVESVRRKSDSSFGGYPLAVNLGVEAQCDWKLLVFEAEKRKV
jgi:hypothetical protein